MSTFSYFPHTEDDIRAMLDRIGVSSLDDLYADVPEKFIYKRNMTCLMPCPSSR